MSVVWLARDDRAERLVALKLVPESLFRSGRLRRFETRDPDSLVLTHANIVRIFDFIADEGSPPRDGIRRATTLQKRARKNGRNVSDPRATPWVTSLCDAPLMPTNQPA